jgi:hypothetical protein
MAICLAIPSFLHYMAAIAAHCAGFAWPLLDDIPAAGVPFPQDQKGKHDVDHRTAQAGTYG